MTKAEWTKDPKERVAYWYQIPDCVPDIVWVNTGLVWAVWKSASAQYVNDHLKSGGMFYGPLDQPPPMPSELKPVSATPAPEKQVNPTAYMAAQAWANSPATTKQTPEQFGKDVAQVYKACLAEIENKPANLSNPNPYAKTFDYFDPRTQAGVNVRQTDANRTGSCGGFQSAMAGKGL